MQKRAEIAGIIELVVGGSLAKSLHGLPPSANSNCTRLGFFELRQHEREHAVLQVGADLALIDLARKPETARIMADVVFGIERLQALIFGKIQSPVDLENAVLNANLDAALLHARHFENDVQRVIRLINVGVR